MKPMKVFLGDQSPWGRGLLRARELKKRGIEFTYVWQDLDVPWVQSGSHSISITNGFPSYCSIKSVRVGSFTPDKRPGLQDINFFNKSKPPAGMSYLTGPKTELTIRAVDGTQEFMKVFKKMMVDELEWYWRIIGQSVGSDLKKMNEEAMNMVKKAGSVWEFIGWLADALGIEVERLSYLMAEDEIQRVIKEVVPENEIWSIDEEWRRFKGKAGRILYCGGKYLPLVIERAGWILGATNLPYYDAPLKVVFYNYRIPGLPELEAFWQGYPTSMSILCLGGEYECEVILGH